LLEAHLLHAAHRRGAQRDLLSYATAARALHANPDTLERGRLGRAAQRLASERPELAGLLLPPFERLLRSVTLLGFGARSPACRNFAAKLLHAGQSDAELAAGLRALARLALPDELS
jgi:hypothetical protein